MSGPWEQYQQQPGPWTQYQGQTAAAPPTLTNTLGTGANTGIVGLLGIPTDAVVNAMDVMRAAYYGGKKALGMMKPEEMPAPLDRSQFVGTTPWLLNQAKQTALGKFMLENRDQSPEGRVLFSAASALPSVALAQPATTAGLLGNAATMAGSNAVGQIASEMGASPATSMLASFGPSAALQTGAAAVRGSVRGGEAGRLSMANRVQTLRDLGVQNIPPGLATGNTRMSWLDSALGYAPGSSLAFYPAANAAQDALGSFLGKQADLMSSNVRGPSEAGIALQRGIGDWKKGAQANVSSIYDQLGNLIPTNETFPLPATQAAAARLQTPIPGMPASTQQVQVPGVQKILSAIQADTAPPTIQTSGGPLPLSPAMAAKLGIPSGGGVPFQGLTALRSEIGPNATTSALIGDKEAGQYKQLYKALSKDIGGAANLVDQQNAAAQLAAAPPGTMGPMQPNPSAMDVWREATGANRTMMAKAKLMTPYSGALDPQAAYGMLSNAMANRGPTASMILGEIPTEARSTIAATKAEQMGLAGKGAQNWRGDKFSSDVFLTNWNKMTPEARQALFADLPQGDQVIANLNKLAQASDWIKTGSKAFSNPSGTARASANIGALQGIGGAFVMGHPMVAAGGLAGLGAGYGIGKLAQSQWFLDQMMKNTQLTPVQRNAHIARLALLGGALSDMGQ